MTSEDAKEILLSSIAKNLREFGYPGAQPEEVLTDDLYKHHAKEMLDMWKETLDKIHYTDKGFKTNRLIYEEIINLLKSL